MEAETKKNVSLSDALIFKRQNLTVQGAVLRPFYLAFAVGNGKKSTIVVGKDKKVIPMSKTTTCGGVGGRCFDLGNLMRKGGGTCCDDAFWVSKKLLMKSTMLQA